MRPVTRGGPALSVRSDQRRRGPHPRQGFRRAPAPAHARGPLTRALGRQINSVVMRNINDGELCDFVALTERMPVEVRFIE
jgi:hypothetical protein